MSEFKPHEYRKRAEQAIGRKLKSHEVVHHHSETQLVICDRSYHRRIHGEMKRRGIPTPKLAYRGTSTVIGFQLPLSEIREIKRMAKNDGRSVAWMVRKLIKTGLAQR